MSHRTLVGFQIGHSPEPPKHRKAEIALPGPKEYKTSASEASTGGKEFRRQELKIGIFWPLFTFFKSPTRIWPLPGARGGVQRAFGRYSAERNKCIKFLGSYDRLGILQMWWLIPI